MTTPAYRSLQARAAAHAQWSKTADRTARTAAAREGFRRRFEVQLGLDQAADRWREVLADDPHNPTATAELARIDQRVESARRAWMLGLALKSAKARARKKGGGDQAA